MENILVLNSSVNREESVSRILIDEALTQLLDADAKAAVIHRDLGANPVPHLTTDNLAGIKGKPSTQPELAARAPVGRADRRASLG